MNDKNSEQPIFDIAQNNDGTTRGDSVSNNADTGKDTSLNPMATRPGKKRKVLKRKEKTIDNILATATKLDKERAMLILSSIADGTARDFTGLPPSLETRIKAIDKLMPMLETEPTGKLNTITVNIVDSTNDDKIKELEKKIINGNKNSETV